VAIDSVGETMAKQLNVSLKPHKSAEAWLKEKSTHKTEEEVKRVTVDLPIALHQKLKIKCVLENVRIADMVRSWIEEKLSE
jgi:hypothetical protein